MCIVPCCRKKKKSLEYIVYTYVCFPSRYGPDKDGKIPSSPRSVVNIESVPIWENLAVGDKNSGIGGQKPWLHTKGELNRRRFGFRFLDSTESPPCVARTIDLGLLFLGTGFFDTKQNYHHVLSNAILPMFSALRDAGVISGRRNWDLSLCVCVVQVPFDARTSTYATKKTMLSFHDSCLSGNKRTQSVVLVYMSTNYYGPQLPTWLLDYLKPLVDEIFVIHHMQYGQCLKIKKAIFGNGAVELGSRGPLWENMYNTGDVVKAIEKIPGITLIFFFSRTWASNQLSQALSNEWVSEWIWPFERNKAQRKSE